MDDGKSLAAPALFQERGCRPQVAHVIVRGEFDRALDSSAERVQVAAPCSVPGAQVEQLKHDQLRLLTRSFGPLLVPVVRQELAAVAGYGTPRHGRRKRKVC